MSDIDTSTTDGENNDEMIEDDLFGANVTIEDRDFGPQYAQILWFNGRPGNHVGLAKTGGFFIDAQQGLDVPGAEPYTHITAAGKEIAGFAIRDLSIIPIRYRKAWRVENDRGFTETHGWDTYSDLVAEGYKPKGRCHILCRVNGVGEPIVVCFSNMAGRAVSSGGKDRGIVERYGEKVVRGARRAAMTLNKDIKYPMCAFSLTIGPDRHDNGKPSYTTVGKDGNTSDISLPVWRDEPEGAIGVDLLKSLYVGAQMLATAQGDFVQGQDWYEAWNSQVLAERSKKVTTTTTDDTAGAPIMGAPPVEGGSLPSDDTIPY